MCSDTNFFLQYAPEFVMWQGILECNKLMMIFVPRREGEIEEAQVEVFANQAFQSLIEWDQSISQTTGTPAALAAMLPYTPAFSELVCTRSGFRLRRRIASLAM